MNDKISIVKRLNELKLRSERKGIPTFTHFLNIDEISILKSEFYENEYSLFGGTEESERCIAGFGTESNEDFPIVCIKIEPINKKFSDNLTHRDFLGATMNLGIERNQIGDIIIYNNIGYMFCMETISQYIIDNLVKIKHTAVKCTNASEKINFVMNKEIMHIIVTSDRIDAVIAGVFKLSRNTASLLIRKEMVYINSKIVSKEGTSLKENNIISVRGHGKFKYIGTSSRTKKDKLIIEIEKYI